CAFAYQDYARSAASVRRCDCCDGSGFTEAEVFTNKIQYPTASHQNGQKLLRVFSPRTGRSGNQFGSVHGFCAKRVTAKGLSAMRVAATAKERCWIRKRQRSRAYRL